MSDEMEFNDEIESINENENSDADENESAVNEPEEQKKSNILSDIMEIVESTLITVFVFVMIFTYFLHPVNVVGGSMNDTLFSGDRIFMSTVYTGISAGDIVIVNNDAAYLLDENGNPFKKDITGSRLKECIIKRVIAVGGQTVQINELTHEVIVDGKTLDEPYIKAPTASFGIYSGQITVPEGYYFVMGDNRNASADSRDGDVGLIKKEQIYGKAVMRYSPIKEFKLL